VHPFHRRLQWTRTTPRDNALEPAPFLPFLSPHRRAAGLRNPRARPVLERAGR